MRRVIAVWAACAAGATGGCGDPAPRPQAGFGRAVMEMSAEQAEREGRKQDAHEDRNAAEKWRAEEREYNRRNNK